MRSLPLTPSHIPYDYLRIPVHMIMHMLATYLRYSANHSTHLNTSCISYIKDISHFLSLLEDLILTGYEPRLALTCSLLRRRIITLRG